jgi:hypothetical protein
MKKAIVLSVMLLAGITFVPSAEAQEMTTTMRPQVRRQVIGVNRRGRVRTVTTTRIRRVGGIRYREVIQTKYNRNGTTTTRVLSRVRIR